MSTGANRREFLQGAAAGLSLSLLASRGASARSAQTPLGATVLTDNVILITGMSTNAVLLINPDGSALVVDSGTAERADELLKFVTKYPGVRHVEVLFNTHWHWNHTGGNERFAKAGAKIWAHENTKLWLTADFYVDWENKAYKARPKEAWPTQTFYVAGKTTFGKDEVVYGYLPRAHTDGDVYVFLPRQNVLVTGGLVTVGTYPILDYVTGGWIGGMDDASKALVAVADDKTIVVPGAGPVQTKADVKAQSEMLTTMHQRLVGLMRKGVGIDDLVADPPTVEFNSKWGDPKLFLANAYHGMWGHVRELGGIV